MARPKLSSSLLAVRKRPGDQMRLPAHESKDHEWLFENGPPLASERALGLVREKQLNVRRRAAGVIAISWAPLIVLAVAGDLLFHTNGAPSLFYDAGAHARYLLAAPLLILAESECGGRLSAIIHNFINAGLVRDKQRGRFERMVRSTRDLIDSRIAEAVVIALAIVVVATATTSLPPGLMPAWHRNGASFSFAGWWHVLVSLPLLIILMLGWVWRFVLWVWILWRIAKLDLCLIASHPDRSAGLCFLGQSLRAFAPVAMAFAVIAAGRSANIVLADGALPTPNLRFNIGLLVGVVALFSMPLLAFSQSLLNVWVDATFKYGALATRIGEIFENKWLRELPADRSSLLETPDYSTVNDLYGVVANVNAVRFVPVDLNSTVALVSAVLLPFVPVVLLAVPLETLWSDVKSLLF